MKKRSRRTRRVDLARALLRAALEASSGDDVDMRSAAKDATTAAEMLRQEADNPGAVVPGPGESNQDDLPFGS